MSRLRLRKPSPAMAVAFVALLVALGGTSYAITKVKGDKLIKKHSLSGNRLKDHTITGTQVKLSQLGKVPNAANADFATAAGSATNATNAVNAQIASTLTPAEAFHGIGTTGNPAFQNSWTNFGGGRTTAGYFIDQQNIVHLKGSISGGASGSTAFTLPAGYRPAATLLLPVTSGSFVIVTATLDSSGNLAPFCNGGCAGSIGLDGLSFRVGAGGSSPSQPSSPARKGRTPDG